MSISTSNRAAAASIRRRRLLFGGSALCSASLFLVLSAQGQTLPAIPVPANIVVITGGAQPTITAPTANALDVNLLATRTVINWDSFHVSGLDKVTFHFGQSTDIVLNKSPTAVLVDAGGQVSGLVGAAAGGNIWFYSPQGVVISPGAIMTAGNFVFGRGDALVDLDFVDATSPLSVLRTASDALIQIDSITLATTVSINATGDLVLSASSGDVNATTALAAGTATLTATAGSVIAGEVTATNGAATVTATGGNVTLNSLSGQTGAFATASADIAIQTATAGSLTGDITLTAGTIASLGSAAAGRDVRVIGPAASLGAATAGGDVLVTATTGTASVTGAVTAGDDIEVTATTGSVSAATAILTSSGSGAGDDAHVLVRSTGGSATAGSATTQGVGVARGDVTVQAAAAASLASGASTRDIKILAPAASLGSGAAAGDVFVTATSGTASVTGTVTAGDDIEITATTGAVSASGATLTSTGVAAADDAHVLVRSTANSVDVGSAVTQGTGVALGDVSIEGATTAALGTGTSTRDLKITGPTASLGSGGAAGDVLVTATTGAANVTGVVTAGDDIEITTTLGSVFAATASLTSTGIGASDDAHVLARSLAGSVTLGSATTAGAGAALGDVVVEAATLATLVSGTSSRDVKVVGPAASLGSASAAGDVFVTATTGNASVTGAVTAGDDIEITATTGAVLATSSSLMSTGVGAADDAHVLARSTGSSVSVGSATTQGTGVARGDVAVEAATTASLISAVSTRDIKVLGTAAHLGSANASGDVFVTATTGPATVTGVVTAGDDIEVTATTGSVVADSASLTSTGIGATDDAHVLARSTGDAVAVGSAITQGSGVALGDVVVEGVTTAALSSGTSSRDIKVTGPAASLGSATASGDVFVTATTGAATVTGTVTAGDDIEVTTTTGAVVATGASLMSTGIGSADDAHVLVRSMGSSVDVGSATSQGTGVAAGDVTLEASTTVTLSVAASASRDVQLLAGNTVLAGASTINAGRDLVARANTGNVTIGTARADDDILLRALAGSVTATGDLEAGRTRANGDPDISGAADALLGATMAGHDLDIKAQTVAVAGHVAAGRAPDANETLGAAQLASDVTVIASSADPSPSIAALRLATDPGKLVTAHQDIILRAENATAGSVTTGGLSAGRDVAIHSLAGNITLGSALAGDDVVLRALNGAIQVAGDVKAGRDSPGMTPVDALGAGDDLNASLPFQDFDGNPATIFSVVGFDVSVISQSVTIGGSTVAGRQPSTDDPDGVGGPIDASTSDVRIETRVSLTPVVNLAPNIVLGSVIATRDLQIDSAKAVTTGDLTAGRDIAVLGRGGVTPGAAPGDHSGSGVTIASARAGDDALAFSVYGRTRVLGSVTSGQPFLRLVPTNDRIIDGATEAADQLAIYLRYFDLDDASAPYVLKGGVIHIAGVGVDVGGNLSAGGVDSDVRIRSGADILVTGDTTATGYAVFQTDTGGGAVTSGAVTAGRDVYLDGAGVLATGTLTSTGGDVAVRARDGGAISLAGISAGDDVVVRGTAQVTIGGPVSSGSGADSSGLGDTLRTTDGSVMLEGQTFDLTGGDIDVRAGSVTTTGALAASGTASDVRVQSAGVINLGAASAGRDVLIDGGAAVTTGLLNAGRDVGVRSLGVGSAVTVGGATAGDDVVIRGKAAITISGALSAGGGADSNAVDQAGDLIFGVAKSTLAGDLDLVGRTVDVRSSAGSILVTGVTTAATDARFQTEATTGGSVTTDAVTAGREVLLDGTDVVATGTLTSTGDVAVRARGGGMISLAGVSAGDDVVVRGTAQLTISGPVSSGSGVDSAGLGDTLRTSEGSVVLEGQTFDLTGGDIDIRAGSVTTTGTMTASGTASDVRVQSAGLISLAAATAGRDVLVDGGSTVSTGSLSAGRDVGVRSLGVGSAVTVGGATAGDDVVIRGTAAITITGALSSGGGADSVATDQAGDLMFDVAKSALAGDFDLVGGTVDVRSSGGSILVTGTTTAATDARFQTQATTGGSTTTGAVTATRNVLLDGAGVTATGTLTSTGGDVAVRARDGGMISLAGVSAGDDVVVRGTAQVAISGPVSSGGGVDSAGLGDILRTSEGSVVLEGQTFDLTGGDIDIRAGSVTTTGTMTASGTASDVRVQSAGLISLGAMSAGRDVLVDGGSTLTTGLLSAGRDVGVRSLGVGSAVTVGGATAGDDVVIRGTAAISVGGALSSGGGTDSADADQAGDLMFGVAKSTLAGDLDLVGRTVDVRSSGGSILVGGATTAATDARFQTQTTTGGSVATGAVMAGRSVLLDGAGVVASGTLTATGDVAVRARDGGMISLAGVSAGDDVVVRGTAQLTIGGPVSSGSGVDSAGLGDTLRTSEGSVVLEGQTFDLTGGDIDVRAGSVTTTGAMAASGTASDVRVQSAGLISLGAVSAGRDVLVDGGAAVTTGLLGAGRDVGVRSLGVGATVTFAGASAGDDVVIRAKGSITITGVLNAGGGADSAAADQAGDLMFGAAKSQLAGDLDLVGRTVDVRSSAGSIQVTGATTAATDARFQTQATTGGSVRVAAVMAGRDVLLDGGAGTGANGVQATGILTAADGDVAVRARDGKAISLVSVTAGDDVALRATGGVAATGPVATTGKPSMIGLVDRLVDATEAGALSVGGLTFDLNGSDIDFIGDTVNLFMTNAFSSVRIKAGSVSVNGGATVGVDILIDSGTSLTVGDLTALGDIALRSRNGSLVVGRLVAGDDIVLRAAMGVTAISLKTGGLERLGVGDQLFASDPTMLGEALNLQGNTIDVKAAGGAIALGSAEATGDVRLGAGSGDVNVSGLVTAGRDILVDGGAVTVGGSLTAGDDVALYGRSGRVSAASITAGDDIVIRASGDVTTSGILKSGQGPDVAGVGDRLIALAGAPALSGPQTEAVGGVIDIRGASLTLQGNLSAEGSNGGVRLQSVSGTTLGDATATGDLLIDAGGDVTAGVLTAGGDIALRSSGGALTIRSATAGDDIVMRAARSVTTSGQITTQGTRDADGVADRLVAVDRIALSGDLDLAGQNIDIKSTTGGITTTGRLKAAGDVRLQASGGLIQTAEVDAGRDVLLDGGAVRAGVLLAARDIAIRAQTGAIALGSAQAGDDLVMRAVGDITVSDAALAVGGTEGAGAGDRLFATDRTGLGGDFDLAGSNIDLKSTSGGITSSGVATSVGDVRLVATGGAVRASDVSAGRDLLIDATSVDSARLLAGRDIAVRAGSIALQSAAAGDDLVLRASGDVRVAGVATAQGAADADGAGDRLFATDRTVLNGELALTGANVDVRSRGAILMGGPVTAGQDARFQTVGDGAISLAAATAGGDILADGGSVRASGQLNAARDVALRGRAGDVEIASVTAGDDIAIRASGSVRATGALASGSAGTATGAADRLIATGESGMITRLVDPTAPTALIEGFTLGTGDIDIRSGEAISLGGALTASGLSSIRLQAGTRLSLAGATAGDAIFTRSRALVLGGVWRAMTARIEVTAAGGLALGDEVTATTDGLALNNLQIGMIDASRLQIFVGDSSGDMRGSALSIGAFAVDTARIKSSLELYAGPLAEVRITGAFAPLSGATNATSVRIGAPNARVGGWTPRSIKVIANNGGSIGVSTTTGGRVFTDVRAFASVELNAKGDILMGYQDFIDKLSATPAASVASVVRSLIAPQTTTGPRMLITAGALTLRADGKVAQQDTGGLTGLTPTGLYLLGAAPGKPQLLLGRTSISASGGSALPEYIELNGALTSGATVMTGQSVSLSNAIAFEAGVTPNQFYRLNTCAILQQGSCTPSTGHSNISIAPDQLTGLTLEDRTAAAGTADPTVASATNEEVWKDPD